MLKIGGKEFMGSAQIMEKIQSLTFQKIVHITKKVDCIPSFDGGILINVLGQIQLDLDPPQSFTQVFHLKQNNGHYRCFGDIFRLVK